MRSKLMVVGVVACVVALTLGGMSFAQPGQGGGPGQRGQGQRGPGQRGQFDPERMREMMTQRMKEQLGVDDAAWKVMEPRLMKVMELNRDANAGGRGMFFGFGGRGGRGGPGGPEGRPGQPDREMSAVEKATDALRTTLESESAPPDQIKGQLQALRSAREKAKQELAAAQQKLREILTLRQEALLVLMGQLS